MPKKRKLNSTNPKYLSETETVKPAIKEKKLLNNKSKFKSYAVFLENPS
jgi:hypothetical protein|tara:strand:+ start:943 stop:1089 length:147 start_codon:yes stop_codon:yes gene_type:complete